MKLKFLKNYLVIFLSIFQLSISEAKSSIEDIFIKPAFGLTYPYSKILKSYYDRNQIFSYGIEINVPFNQQNLAIYFIYQKQSFKIKDPSLFENISVNNHWFTFGFQKNYKTDNLKIYGRLGFTYHYDDLSLSSSDDPRIGLQPSFGFCTKLVKNVNYFVEFDYEFEKLSVPSYLSVNYSRHQTYLSGKKFQTSGLQIKTGIAFSLLGLINNSTKR